MKDEMFMREIIYPTRKAEEYGILLLSDTNINSGKYLFPHPFISISIVLTY